MIDKLSAAEQAALARQGSVCEERRGGRTYYKLRFRLDGRQRVRYLGRDPGLAELVRQELHQLQQPLRAARRIRKLVKTSRCAFATTKRQLAPLLQQAGYAFHGRSVRRRRRSTPAALPAPAVPKRRGTASDDVLRKQ